MMEIIDQEPSMAQVGGDDFSFFGWKKLLTKIKSNWHWFIVSLVVCLSASWIWNRFTTPVYAVKSSILIFEHRNSFLTENEGISGQVLQGFSTNQRGFYNQIILLRSKSLMAKAARALGLEVSYFEEGKFSNRVIYQESPFQIEWDERHPQLTGVDFRLKCTADGRIFLQLTASQADVYDYLSGKGTSLTNALDVHCEIFPGEPFCLPGICCFSVVPKDSSIFSGSNSFLFRFHTLQELTNSYRSKITVEFPDRETTVVDLLMKDQHEQRAADFLNKLMELYQAEDVERKNLFADRTILFMEHLVAGIRDSLDITGRELLAFKASNRVINISAQADNLLVRMNQLSAEEMELAGRKGYFTVLRKYVWENESPGSLISPSSSALDDPILSSLIADFNRLTLEQASLQGVKSAPVLHQIMTESAKVKAAILDNVDDIIRQIDIALSRLAQKYETLDSTARQLPSMERDLLNIERKYNLNNETYTFLLQKLSEAQIAKASNQPESQVVEAADSLGRVAPRTARIFETGFLAGFCIPFIVILLTVLLSNKIAAREDVAALSEYPVIGMIYLYKSSQKTLTPLLDNPNSPVNEPYRNLRYKLNLMVKGKEKPVIAVTSTSPGEGKTFTAINVASSFALARKRTVLVDFDLRNSKIGETFALDPENGLVNFIMGQKKLEDIIHKFRHANFHVIPSGPIPPNPGEMLADDKTAIFLRELKERFDVIIIDSAPVGFVADLFQVASQVDSLLYVVRDNFTNRSWLKQALDELRLTRMKGVAVIINAVRQSKSYSQGYGYGYGYGINFENGSNRMGGKRKMKFLS